MVNTELLDKVIQESQKQYGTTFYKGSEYPNLMRIPFHSPELNIATGGGIPMGKISRVWGQASAGKSLTSLLLARNAQNIHIFAQQLLDVDDDEVKQKGQDILDLFPEGMKVCWYDVEGSFDKEFASHLGVNVDEIEVFDDRRIEVVGSVLEAAMGAAHLHIIDSTAGGVSIDELKEKMEKWQRGLKARVWNKVVDRFQARMDRRQNAIVFIDQVRIDQTTGAYIIPGGEKMRHESAMTIQLRRGRWLYQTDGGWTDSMPQKEDTPTGKAEARGVEIKAHVEKNKVGTAQRRALMRYNMRDKSFDIDWEITKLAEYFKVVDRSGNWFVLPDGTKVNGTGQLQQALSENAELKKQAIDTIEKLIVKNP
jgi:RecA/RadA recombinase